MKHAWSHPNLICGSFFHDDANGRPSTASTSPANVSTTAEGFPVGSILESMGRRIRNGAIQIARQFCEYRSAQVSADMARALLKPEDPARLPRIFFVSLSWAAPPYELEQMSNVSSLMSDSNPNCLRSQLSMEYRDHEMVIIKRHAKPSAATVNASQIFPVPLAPDSPRGWPFSMKSSSKTHIATVSDFEYELVQGYIADGADASLSTQTSAMESANTAAEATSSGHDSAASEVREFRGMDSERWRASGHSLAAPFGSVGMTEFLACVRRHAGVHDRSESRDAPPAAKHECKIHNENSAKSTCGSDTPRGRGNVNGNAADAAGDGVGDSGGGVRFCSQLHRRWLGGSHERALDGRRGCWTGVSMRELRDEHIEFGPHYVPTDVVPENGRSRVPSGGKLNRDGHDDGRVHVTGSKGAEYFDCEDKVHAEDEAATPVAWRLRAFRVQQQKSRSESISQRADCVYT